MDKPQSRTTPASGIRKEHDIRFAHTPRGQAEEAIRLLTGLEGLETTHGSSPHVLHLTYDLAHYTYQGLLQALTEQGFHLDNSLPTRIMRSLIVFCEETELDNLRAPERLLKRSNEIYVTAWEHHNHGDKDDAPPEWRDYR